MSQSINIASGRSNGVIVNRDSIMRDITVSHSLEKASVEIKV